MTELTPDSKLAIPPHVVSRAIDDESVLLNLESGLYFGVDQIGQMIWRLVGEGLALSEIIDAIVTEYLVETDQAKNDVFEFAKALIEKGLLTDQPLELL